MHRLSARVVHVSLAVSLTAISLAPVFAATYFPSQNGPWYLLAGHMLTHLFDPAYDYSQHYAANLHAIPHILHTVLVSAFAVIVPTLWAQKLALSVYVIGLPLSIFYFLGAAAPKQRWLGFFSFLMIHTYCFYRGYHNFSLSIPLYFATLGCWLRALDRPSGVRYVVTLVLVSLTYLSHLFTFGILAASMGWYLLCTTRRFWYSTGTAIRFTWPGWLMMLEFVWLNSQINTWVDTTERVWLAPHTAIEYFFRKYFYTTSIPVYLIGAACSLWVIGLLGVAMYRAFRSDRPIWDALLSRPWLSLTCILGICYFFLPWKFLNWHYVNVRLVPFIVGLSLAAVGHHLATTSRPRLQRWYIGSCAVSTILISVLMFGEVRTMNGMLDEYTAAIPYLPRNSRLLPINSVNPQVGQVRPLTRAYEYYHISRGGVNGTGAAIYNTLVPVRYRVYPDDSTLPKYQDGFEVAELDGLLRYYDAILIWGYDPALVENLTGLGCETAFSSKNLVLLTCPVEDAAAESLHARTRTESTESLPAHPPRTTSISPPTSSK
ncbi:hypothetical protein Mal4_03590 [Maioricimonas rarisocia]|uniref:Glycosyltransferase RgtA/B/C/D-like domain-containing protein n=1 Tax=Maioricimonas rarisocia TaxID=2528026 RepID=A0A517Z0S0_9PLAN|nr:hypothetical protein [Maioricimonas rarisocia]QDU36076.1 hypothetical protein Mal4_03590 [Maioricimonas rarisocia]